MEALLDSARHPQRSLVDAIRRVIASAVPTAKESVKWNAPSFATTEHFATFNLRGSGGVQLVLHLGAKSRSDIDLREVLPTAGELVEWKGPDRAVVRVRDEEHFGAIRKELATLIRSWSRYVG